MKTTIALITLFFNFSFCKTVFITPILNMSYKDVFYKPDSWRDMINKPFCELRKKIESLGYNIRFDPSPVNISDDDIYISICRAKKNDINCAKKVNRKNSYLLLFEPPTIQPELYRDDLKKYFGKIFTMFDDDVDNINYFKLYYPQPKLEIERNLPKFSHKKLCAIITSAKGSNHSKSIYSYRGKIIKFLCDLGVKDFDIYGTGNDRYKNNFKGKIAHKRPVLKKYKFSFCYENMGYQNGYVTEKIFDSMVSGCVPVYLGAENISRYVPSDCFIDRRKFKSNMALYNFLRNMKDKTYNKYLQNIRNYLTSDQAKLFSVENFVNIITKDM